MREKIYIMLILMCAVFTLGANEPFDTTIDDWDYKLLTENRWMMDVIGTMGWIPEVGIDPVVTGEDEEPIDIPEEIIAGYEILRPDSGIEYYAILEDEIERAVLLRQADGSVFLNNNQRREGVFAIRELPDNPGVYYKDVLKWPLQYPNYQGEWAYLNEIPESYSYPGKGGFYEEIDEYENTLEGVYLNYKGKEDFRLIQLSNHDWRLSMALPMSQEMAYGNFFDCFIRKIEPGVWESDGAFGIGYRLVFEPENRRIRLIWNENEWKGFPLRNTYLYPYYDVYTEDGQLLQGQN